MRAKVIKANKSLFVLGSLRKEGMSQGQVDHLFHAIVLPNFSYRAPVAQLVEHRVVMREVVSSTPAGPTLRVLK